LFKSHGPIIIVEVHPYSKGGFLLAADGDLVPRGSQLGVAPAAGTRVSAKVAPLCALKM
jgi:hypothetical protein